MPGQVYMGETVPRGKAVPPILPSGDASPTESELQDLLVPVTTAFQPRLFVQSANKRHFPHSGQTFSQRKRAQKGSTEIACCFRRRRSFFCRPLHTQPSALFSFFWFVLIVIPQGELLHSFW